MSMLISLLIQGVLDLIGTILDGMDFLMAARKDLDHFLQKMLILREVEAIGRSFRRYVRLLVDPDSFPRLGNTFVTGWGREG